MKKIFLLVLLVALLRADRTYAQSVGKPYHKKINTDCRVVLNDTCQTTHSYTIFQSSKKVNKKMGELPPDSFFICPIADDIYRRILGAALKGIQIAY